MVSVPVLPLDIEYVTITGVDPTNSAEVIAAIRVLVPYGLAKAKYIGNGSTESPDYAWELSTADELTRLYDDMAGSFVDTNITTGVVADASEPRSFGFGNQTLGFTSVSGFQVTDGSGTTISYASGDITLAATGIVDATSSLVRTIELELRENGNDVSILPPTGLTGSYGITAFTQLPSAGQVGADQNYVRIDENGQLTYSAAVGTGQGTDLSLGNRTATTMEVVSSTGDNVLLLESSSTEAGLVTSTQHDLIETIPSLPTEDTSIVAGTLPPADGIRNVNLDSNNLNFINIATVNFDGPIVSTSSITQSTANLAANANTIGQTAPAGLASSYSVEWLDALPTAGDVSSDANFLRISDAGKLTFTNVPMTTDTSLTIGTLATAVDDRTANFGGNSLNLINTSQITMASAGIVTVSAPTINASSATVRNAANELVEGGQSVTLLPPTPATVTYSIEMFDQLPTAQQVADDENFLRIDATGKLLFTPAPGSGPIDGTNLSLINRTATDFTVASDTGSNALCPPASSTLAGLVTATQHDLIETIPSLPTEDTSLTAGAIADAAENRTINFAGFNWVTNNVANLQITATNAAITNGSGTALNITGTDVRLDAQGVISCTADVDASGVTVSTQQLTVKASGNANTVNLTAPAALAAGYGLEYFDALPSAGDVTNSLNYVRVDNLGKLYLGAAGGGPGATTIWETVANKAARTAAPIVVGYFSFVQSNQTKYVWDGLAYQIDAAEAVGTTTERNSLTEVEDDMIFTDVNDHRIYRYDSAEDPPWVQVG